MNDLERFSALLDDALLTVTADTDAVLRRAVARERRRRLRMRLAAGSSAAVLAAAAALALVVAPQHHDARPDTLTVAPTSLPVSVPRTTPAAVITSVVLPSSWSVLNVHTGPLPTGTSSRITDRDYRFTDAGFPEVRISNEIEVDLQTGDVTNALAETAIADPAEHSIALRRPGASRILYDDSGGQLRSWSWLEQGVYVQVIARGTPAPDIPFVTGLRFSAGSAAPFIRTTIPVPASSSPATVPGPGPIHTLDAAQLSDLRAAFGVPATATIYSASEIGTEDAQTVVFRHGSSQVIISTQILDLPIPLDAAVDITAKHSLATDGAGDAFAVSASGDQFEVTVTNRYGQLARVEATAAGTTGTYLADARTYLHIDDPAEGLAQ